MRYILSVLIGLILGSFANVCILRLPEDQSLAFPRSHCPCCHQALKVFHNIPIVSYLVLRGRCAYCGVSISLQYPLIEALMAALFIFHAWFFTEPLRIVLADVLGFYLICISIIDYRHRIIPDELSLSLAIFGFLFSMVNPYLDGPPWMKLLVSVASGLSGGILMYLLAFAGEKAFKKEALGGGRYQAHRRLRGCAWMARDRRATHARLSCRRCSRSRSPHWKKETLWRNASLRPVPQFGHLHHMPFPKLVDLFGQPLMRFLNFPVASK